MFKILLMLSFASTIACCFGRQAAGQLPKPHYQPDKSDPQWLTAAVQFHGHLGPWAVAGLRAGMAGRLALDAEGYFDLDVTVEGPMAGPPQSCFIDGLQVSTGATLGKRNIKWVEAQRIVVRVTNTRTGKTAQLRPTGRLMELLTSFKPRSKTAEHDDQDDHDDHEHDDHERQLEATARRIATMPDKDILDVELPSEKR